MVDRTASELVEVVAAAAAGPDDLDRATSALASLRRLRAWCDAKDVALTAIVRRCTPAPEGHLKHAGRLSDNEAEQRTERSRTAEELAPLGSALANGEIRGEHMDAVARARRRLDPAERERFDRNAEQLAGMARQTDPATFGRYVSRKAQQARALDGEDELARQRRSARCRTYVSKDTGMWVLHLEVDPLTGVKLDTQLRAALDAMFADAVPDTCPKDPFEKQDHLRALAATAMLLGETGTQRAAGPPEVIVVVDTRCAAHSGSEASCGDSAGSPADGPGSAETEDAAEARSTAAQRSAGHRRTAAAESAVAADEPGATAEAHNEAESSTEAEAGTAAEAHNEAEPGAETEPGATAEPHDEARSGADAAPGATAESHDETESGTETEPGTDDPGADQARAEADEAGMGASTGIGAAGARGSGETDPAVPAGRRATGQEPGVAGGSAPDEGDDGGGGRCTPGQREPVVDWGLPVELPPSVLAGLYPTATVSTIVLCRGAVIHAPGRLDLGRTTRLANRAQRRVLRAMYPGCAIPGCRVRFDLCKIHHVHWWRHGGPTDLDNLLPICTKHHDLVHNHGWGLRLRPDRTLTVTRPDGRTMTTGPPSRHAA